MAFIIIFLTKIIVVLAFVLHLPIVMYVMINEIFDNKSIALDEYAYNTLRTTDIMLCSMMFGTERATISGWTYHLGEVRGSSFYTFMYKFINVILFDDKHCIDAYLYETQELDLREYKEDPWVKH